MSTHPRKYELTYTDCFLCAGHNSQHFKYINLFNAYNNFEVGTIILLMLQMRKLRHRCSVTCPKRSTKEVAKPGCQPRKDPQQSDSPLQFWPTPGITKPFDVLTSLLPLSTTMTRASLTVAPPTFVYPRKCLKLLSNPSRQPPRSVGLRTGIQEMTVSWEVTRGTVFHKSQDAYAQIPLLRLLKRGSLLWASVCWHTVSLVSFSLHSCSLPLVLGFWLSVPRFRYFTEKHVQGPVSVI